MSNNLPQPAQEVLGRLATPEHLLHVVTELARKWRKHDQAAEQFVHTNEKNERHRAMAAAYCKSLEIVLDQPFSVVWAALENGDL